MSQRNSTALAVGASIGGAAIAAFVSMGTAHAVGDADGYSDLFGATGTPGVVATQGAADSSLDTQLFDQNPGDAASFDQAVDSFQAFDDHPIAGLINSIDPAAFVTQTDPDIVGTLAGGGYLVPDDFLGYLATDLDFFVLNPTGLGFLLSPVVDLLLGSPPF
jgi:hypothetical protein